MMGSGMTLPRWSLAALISGVVGGVVWRFVTHPAIWVVTAAGATMSEDQSARQFGAVVTFVVIGAVISFLFGVAITMRLGDHWSLVPLVAVLSGAAAGLAWTVGHLLGPHGPSSADRASIGARIPSALTVDAAAPFVAWAVFGVAGVLVGTWVLDRLSRREAPAVPD